MKEEAVSGDETGVHFNVWGLCEKHKNNHVSHTVKVRSSVDQTVALTQRATRAQECALVWLRQWGKKAFQPNTYTHQAEREVRSHVNLLKVVRPYSCMELGKYLRELFFVCV